MEQVLFAGRYDALNTGTDEYSGLVADAEWHATEHQRCGVVSPPGKLKNLRVKLNDSPGEGKSYTFTVRVNGADSDDGEGNPLQVIIADAATSGLDTTHEITVSAGDKVCLECSPSGTPTARYARWSTMFEGDTANESMLLGAGYGVDWLTTYDSISSGKGSLSAAPKDNYQVVPMPGTIKNWYIELQEDPGTDPDAYRYTLVKNGDDTALVITITANATSGNNTSDEVAVSAGDYLYVKQEPLNSPSLSVAYAAWGCTFLADTDGESLVLGVPKGDDLHATDTEYKELCSASNVWSATENQHYVLGQVCILRNLYVKLENAPGEGKSFTFTVRHSGSSSDITCIIADTDTIGNDTAHAYSVIDDDDMTLECAPSETPAVGNSAWGIVCFIAVGVAHEKELSDTVAIADSIVKGIGMNPSDSVAIAEIFGREVEFYRTPTDTVAIADAISKAIGIPLGDSVAIAETLVKAIALNPSDTVAIVDAFSRVVEFYRTPSDTVTIADAIGKAMEMPLADSVAVVDSLVKAIGVNLAETVAIVDAISKGVGISLSDTVAITDAITKMRVLVALYTLLALRVLDAIRTQQKERQL